MTAYFISNYYMGNKLNKKNIETQLNNKPIHFNKQNNFINIS